MALFIARDHSRRNSGDEMSRVQGQVVSRWSVIMTIRFPSPSMISTGRICP
jgi:hypothetical protein